MSLRVSARERRTVVGAVSILGAAWLVTRGAPAVAERWTRAREAAEQRVEALERARVLLNAGGAVRSRVAARAQALVGLAPRLFAGTTVEDAAADLSAFVSGSATLCGVRLVRQESRPDSAGGGFYRLSVRLEAEGDIVGVMRWLADLEHGQKLVTLDPLRIAALEPAAGPDQPERLRLEAVVQGVGMLVRPGQSDAKGATR